MDDEILHRPCIEVRGNSVYNSTHSVAGYQAELALPPLQQPYWASDAPPVHQLGRERPRWGAYVVDIEAYEAQMMHLLGLD
jgi:hypothetical protein